MMGIIKKTYGLLGLLSFRTERRYENVNEAPQPEPEPDNTPLKIAFYNGGGMGDSIIDVAFIQNLRKILPPDTVVDYYAKSGKTFLKCPFVSHVFNDTRALDKNQYDLAMGNHRFWMVTKFNEEKVMRMAPILYDFCRYQLDLRNKILRNNNDNNNLYSQYAVLLGKNRWEQVDLKEITGFNRNNTLYMPLSPEYFSVLKRNHLEPKRYITINRGVDSNLGEDCPKLWPLEHYKNLVKLLRKKYPDLKIIQIGANDKYGVIDADLNLLGKTDIEETKILLKNSLIHIDVEGGLVHLNHILHGKSCVIFGPTPVAPLQYPENINLKNNACPHFCDWVIQDWQKACLRGINPPPCMAQTKPEDVLAAVSDYIDKYQPYSYKIGRYSAPDYAETKIYWLGEVTDLFNELLNYHIIRLSEHVDNTHDSLKITTEYGNLYNLPQRNDEISCVVWVPKVGDQYQNMTFNELLRVVCPGGKIIVYTKTLGDDMKKLLKTDINGEYITITKE